jgi:ribosomal protein S18 acetylase RimI-like enzyme
MPAYVQSSKPFIIREATRLDIPAIMRLKLELALVDDSLDTVQPTAADWERDGFGATAHFDIFAAEWAGRTVGIAICRDRHVPGWVGPAVVLYDFCVEKKYRCRGIGTALLGRVAEFAHRRGSAMVELTMRAANRASRLCERVGFACVSEARHYVIAGDALERLATPAARPAERMAG